MRHTSWIRASTSSGASWRGVGLFEARRADIEGFGRHLETVGRARATIARRLCTVACFLPIRRTRRAHSGVARLHARRPRLDYESHAVGLDRNEVGAILV